MPIIWTDPVDDAQNALLQFVEASTTQLQDRNSEETFDHCLICDEVDSHLGGCPVPVAAAWLQRGQ